MSSIPFFMRFRWSCFCTFFCLFPASVFSQTLGGQSAYSFLKLPSSPLQTAAGGVNISYRAEEVGLTSANPALLSRDVSQQINASFHAFFAGTKGYSLTGALYSEKLKTTFGSHVSYLDYGTLTATDAMGNVMGEFRPADFVVQAAVSKQYLEKWTYGLAVKFIQSTYRQYQSNAIAADIGVLYVDSANAFSASVVVKNMGAQLKTYAGTKEELPFELQAGITKRLAKAPLGFSVTAQQLQVFDILYRDTAFNRDNNISAFSSFATKLLTHFVLAMHLYLGSYIEGSIGYNVLQRKELSVADAANGLTGFSGGLRLRLPKLQILYAHTGYQRGVAANQIGVSVYLDRLFGLGK